MSEIGASEANGKGKRLVITKRGNPMVEPIPSGKRDPEKIRATIKHLKAFQKVHCLGGLSVREMIEEGRKY